MEQSFPKFSSPVASQKRWNSRNKRKCSFGSSENPDKKKVNQRKIRTQENRSAKSNFNDSIESDPEFSSPINWADEVEKEERSLYIEKARRKYKQQQGPRKKLDMDKKQKKDGAGGQNSPLETIVTDPHRLNQRQKQIDMGKNTLGYEMYIKHVSRKERKQEDPWTPDKYQQCSTRSWQGQMKKWRRCLHMWDPEDVANDSADPFAASSFCSEGDVLDIMPSSSGGSSQTSDYGSVQVNSSFDNELFGYFAPERVMEQFDSFPL